MKQLLLSTWAILVAFVLSANAQEFTFFVDKDSLAEDPTGLSWEDAFQMLQPAIDAADAAIQSTTQPMQARADIWIAEGVYDEERNWSAPDSPERNRGSLALASNVHLFGGFSGEETSETQRNIQNNETVITGKESLDGGPALDAVVAWDIENATLNGIRLDGDDIGSGFTVVLSNDIIVQNCVFEEVSGGQGIANALGVGTGSSISVRDSQFIRNQRQGSGGAVLLDGEATFIDCLFEDNRAGAAGGAIKVRGGGSATIENCRFVNNTGDTPSSGAWGGAVSSSGGDLIIKNSLFFGNVANRGAAIGHNGSPRGAQITNCTFVANSTNLNSIIFTEGGGMSLENSIFWDNQGTLFGSNFSGIQATIKDNLIQDLSDMSVTGLPDRFMDHNIEADPLFVSAAKMDFRLQPMSPAIDIGAEQVTDPLDEDIKTGPAPDEDIAGIMRPQLSTWDLGMHEYRPGYENDVDANNAINAVDVQNVINGALGLPTPNASYTDTNFDGFSNAVDVQRVINAALGILTK